MLIGYSCWGFLGPGITDTPDGGRAHRRTLIDGLQTRGHQILLLQPNRDLDEAGHDLTDHYTWHNGLPDIDALFLEWRWPIPGRNTTPCGSPGHTCDLHRQQQLLEHYTTAGLPTLLWDKDRQLPADDPLRQAGNVAVSEPALYPTPGAVSLRFPVADTTLDCADPIGLAAMPRDLPLVYVGNQYDRDEQFNRFFGPAARDHVHLIAGKWPHTARWPGLTFAGRVPFTEVHALYGRSVATVVLLPDRYACVAHVTQRLFEASLSGCLPLMPTAVRDAARFVPADLLVRDGADANAKVQELGKMAGSGRHAELVADCIARLDLFRLSRQLDTIEHTLAALVPQWIR